MRKRERELGKIWKGKEKREKNTNPERKNERWRKEKSKTISTVCVKNKMKLLVREDNSFYGKLIEIVM